MERGIKLFNAVCTLCESKEDIQIDHVKRVADIEGKTELEIRIKDYNRKQIPLCRSCHLKLHENSWQNKPVNPKSKSKKDR